MIGRTRIDHRYCKICTYVHLNSILVKCELYHHTGNITTTFKDDVPSMTTLPSTALKLGCFFHFLKNETVLDIRSFHRTATISCSHIAIRNQDRTHKLHYPHIATRKQDRTLKVRPHQKRYPRITRIKSAIFP